MDEYEETSLCIYRFRILKEYEGDRWEVTRGNRTFPDSRYLHMSTFFFFRSLPNNYLLSKHFIFRLENNNVTRLACFQNNDKILAHMVAFSRERKYSSELFLLFLLLLQKYVSPRIRYSNQEKRREREREWKREKFGILLGIWVKSRTRKSGVVRQQVQYDDLFCFVECKLHTQVLISDYTTRQ